VNRSHRNTAIAAAVAGLTLAGSWALAQNVQEVTVQATRAVNTKIVGHSSAGVPITALSLSYGVSLAGLNLATNSGAVEAQQRINDAALAACKELGRQYPDASPGDMECAKAAASKSMSALHELVVAAEKAATQR